MKCERGRCGGAKKEREKGNVSVAGVVVQRKVNSSLFFL